MEKEASRSPGGKVPRTPSAFADHEHLGQTRHSFASGSGLARTSSEPQSSQKIIFSSVHLQIVLKFHALDFPFQVGRVLPRH